MLRSTLNAATLLAFLVGLGGMGSARAQSSSVVLVLGDGQSPESAAAISALSQQIAANPRVSMAPATDLTRALVGPLP
ncbi:MAG: hypothetical protein KJO07_13290, partial [Deltaproteobacteria bacterium]|nr:hypothetical protein [Deltaproteobacteria bacterium]